MYLEEAFIHQIPYCTVKFFYSYSIAQIVRKFESGVRVNHNSALWSRGG